MLFLDELGEFPVSVLDALRQPLEEGCVRVSRAHASATMPARFQLVAAMNPCPCGYSGFATCRCAPSATVRYARRVSGPLLDRFDLRIMVEAPAPDDLLDDRVGEASSVVATRVADARRRARERGVRSNAELTGKQVERGCPLDDAARRLLAEAVASGRVSARGVRRIRTVALTLDDLAGGSGRIGVSTLAEAMALRADVSLADASVTQ